MSAATTKAARRLLDATGEHPVVSVYFSLDPSEFATAPARKSEIDSLIDQGTKLAKPIEETLDHDGKMALRADLDRIRDYLFGDEMPVTDLAAMAIFASGADDVWQTVPLATAAGPTVAVGPHPVVEPLVVAPASPAWCAVLPSMERADIYVGVGVRVLTHQHDSEYIRHHPAEGGPTGHDEEQDVANHLTAVARRLQEDFDEGRFSVLAIGGPVEPRSHFEKLLSPELRAALIADRLDVDPSAITEAQLGDAMATLVESTEAKARTELLTRLTDELGKARGGDAVRAVLGIDAVTQALTEARVGTLLLADQFTGDEREAMIRSAVALDAEVVAFGNEITELGPARPVAALLRF